MMFLFTFIFYTHSYALFIYQIWVNNNKEKKCYQIVSGRKGKRTNKNRYSFWNSRKIEIKPSFKLSLLLLADQSSTFGTFGIFGTFGTFGKSIKKACKHTNSATTCSFSPVENNLYIYFTRTFILFTRS
jgi:hypothetical protein